MRIIKELQRQKISPIYVIAGDRISVHWKMPGNKIQEVLSSRITKTAKFTEAVLFEGEEDGKKTLGTYLLQ